MPRFLTAIEFIICPRAGPLCALDIWARAIAIMVYDGRVVNTCTLDPRSSRIGLWVSVSKLRGMLMP